MTDRAPTEREPRTDQMTAIASDALDTLEYVMKYGDTIAIYAVIKERGLVIPSLEAAGAATETGGLDPDAVFAALWAERDRLDAGISGFNKVLYRRAARSITARLRSPSVGEDTSE